MPLLKESLQKESFYQNSMSLFLKGSPGIPERCRNYYNILMNVLNCGEDIFKYLDIFYYDNDKDYFDLITNSVTNGANSRVAYDNKWLDLIAEWLGISRQVYCHGGQYKVNEDKDVPGGKLDGVSAVITLSNYELLIYIQATIAKYNFDGTCKKLREIYRGTPIYLYDKYIDSDKYNDERLQKYLANNYKPSLLSKLGIWYIANTASASARIGIGADSVTDNIYTLFLNGFLTIESVGITYEYLVGTSIYTAVFTKDPLPANTLDKFSNPPSYITTFAKEASTNEVQSSE